VEKFKILTSSSITLFQKFVLLMRKGAKILKIQTGHTRQYGECAFHVCKEKAINTHRICNIYFYSTAIIFT
jgi:hypothetical protein